jgi:hypothetical protein
VIPTWTIQDLIKLLSYFSFVADHGVRPCVRSLAGDMHLLETPIGRGVQDTESVCFRPTWILRIMLRQNDSNAYRVQ